jgi:magnesium-transporting ATPase (P-type)
MKDKMNIPSFVLATAGITLTITLVTALITVFILGQGELKFEPMQRLGVFLITTTVNLLVILTIISLFLFLTRAGPTSSSSVFIFAITLGIYIEGYRVFVDKFQFSNGTMWLPLIFTAIVPSILGIIFFKLISGQSS